MTKKNSINRKIWIGMLVFCIGCQNISTDQNRANMVQTTRLPHTEISPFPEHTPEQTEAPENTSSITPTGVSVPLPLETPVPSATPVPDRTGVAGVISRREIIISEIMYNPNSPDSDWEWVEVYNDTSAAIDLSGWVMDDGNGTPHMKSNIMSGNIPPHKTAILFNSDALNPYDFKAAWNMENTLIPVTDWGTMGLNNSGDKISLWDNFSAYEGDHLSHTKALFTIEYSDDSPWPADNGSGSIFLKDLSSDYTNGENWALSTIGEITPIGTCRQSTAEGTNTGADIGSPE